MTDGMRRPPKIWEQKLEALVRSSGFGVGSSSSGTSPIVGGPTPGPGGPAESFEPPPIVDLDPETPRLPAAPSVFAAIGGLSVLWTGLDSAGVPFPTGTTVQLHISTSTGFTPDGTTLRAVLAPGERSIVTGLTSGVTHFVRFVLVAPDGALGGTTAQVSAVAGFILSTNIGTGVIEAGMVSFDATAIGGIQQFVGATAPAITGSGDAQLPKNGSTWINTTEGSYYTLTAGVWVKRQWDTDAIAVGAISTLQIATGAITADSAIIADAAIGNAKIIDLTATKLTAGTIDANVITVNNLNADNITTGTITGRQFRTAASGARIKMADTSAEYGTHSIEFFNDLGTRVVALAAAASGLGTVFLVVGNTNVLGTLTAQSTITAGGNINATSGLVSCQTLSVSGSNVDMAGVHANNTTGIDTVGITGSPNFRLRRISSSQDIKYDMAALSGALSTSVDAERQLGTPTVVPLDVLNLAVTEFSVIDREFPPKVEGQEELPPPIAVATDRRVLGFVADDVADKFPIAATTDAEGKPGGVLDTAILAALLAVVKQQQATITDLTARIEALEA